MGEIYKLYAQHLYQNRYSHRQIDVYRICIRKPRTGQAMQRDDRHRFVSHIVLIKGTQGFHYCLNLVQKKGSNLARAEHIVNLHRYHA